MIDPKQVVTDFLATFSSGDVEAILAGLTNDATWWVAGRIEGMSGTNNKQTLGNLLTAVKPLYRAGALRITPSTMIAEGDLVACEAESYAELQDGRVYANQYHFLFQVAGAHIRRVREYSDTHHMLETFSS
ncbi:nuclear transport factor 2 family protein [Sphingomonas sp. 1P06PA]|uniref:nuclear transport factor 2 family protein n=1 Tax=Sphingomonas sp. 1P06PA TaxID=554121 RepID=UPI0039A59ED3